tara:strand:- start:140 stop:289 length:150 start_codon:yes stop_codon:yes gene_type:complete
LLLITLKIIDFYIVIKYIKNIMPIILIAFVLTAICLIISLMDHTPIEEE